MIHFDRLGKHEIHPKYMKQLIRERPIELIIPCNECDEWLKIVMEEYDDLYIVGSMGKKRG